MPSLRYFSILISVVLGTILFSTMALAESRPSELVRLDSAHFHLFSELPAAQQLAILERAERYYSGLSTALQQWFPERSMTVTAGEESAKIAQSEPAMKILALKSADAIATIAPINTSAHSFSRYNRYEPDIEPVVFIIGTADDSTWHTLKYAIAQRLLTSLAGTAPSWLVYGVAEYCASARLTNKAFELGYVPEDFSFYSAESPPHDAAWTDVAKLPTADQLLSAKASAFNDTRQGYLYYAASWLLFDLLTDPRGPYVTQAQRYLRLLSLGNDHDEAFTPTLGRLDVTALEQDYRHAFLARGEHIVRFPVDDSQPTKLSPPITLSAASIALLWAQLRPWQGNQLSAVADELEQALALEPDSEEILFWSAKLAAKLGHFREAEKGYRVLADRHPDRAVYWLGLVTALTKEQGQKPPTQQSLETLSEPLGRLETLASSSAELNVVAHFYAAAHEFDRAAQLTQRSLARDPACISCLDTLALAEAGRGHYREARRAEARAVALSPSNDNNMRRRLAEYSTKVEQPD